MTVLRTAVACALVGLATGAATADDYAGIKVTGTAVIEKMHAGPGISGAVLSPDGALLIQVDGRDLCLWQVKGIAPWTQLGCARSPDSSYGTPSEEVLWSRDLKAALLPTFGAAFQRFEDSDIAVFDAEAMAVRVLTEDGIRSLKKATAGYVDVTPRWLDADTIVFARYRIEDGSFVGTKPIELATIERDGTGLKTLAIIERSAGALLLAMAVSPDGSRIVYDITSERDPDLAGLWVLPVAGGAPERLLADSDLNAPAQGLAFSPDGEKLLIISPGLPDGYPRAAVFDFATEQVVEVTRDELGGVGWSPSGHALIYSTDDRERSGKPTGLMVAGEPGEIGERVLDGRFYPATCCSMQPMTWAANDSLVVLNYEYIGDTFFVQLGH